MEAPAQRKWSRKNQAWEYEKKSNATKWSLTPPLTYYEKDIRLRSMRRNVKAMKTEPKRYSSLSPLGPSHKCHGKWPIQWDEWQAFSKWSLNEGSYLSAGAIASVLPSHSTSSWKPMELEESTLTLHTLRGYLKCNRDYKLARGAWL